MENQHWQHIISLAFVFRVLQYLLIYQPSCIENRQQKQYTYFNIVCLWTSYRIWLNNFQPKSYIRNTKTKFLCLDHCHFYDKTLGFFAHFLTYLMRTFGTSEKIANDLTISYSHIVWVFRLILPHNPVFVFYCPLVYWDFLGLRMWNKLWAILQIHNAFICTPQVLCV